MNTLGKLLLGVTMCLCLSIPSARAVFYHWTGGAGTTDWFQSGNWNTAGYPDAGDSPRMGVSSSYSPTLWPHYNGDNSPSPTDGAFLVSQVMNAWFYMDGGTYVQSAGNVIVGNGSGFTGTWTHNGGSFTASASTFSIAPVTSSGGNLILNTGSITANTLNLGTGASATGNLIINGGLFYANTYVNLNNSSKTGTEANVTIGNGGTLSADRAEFYKSATIIGPGGLFEVRNTGNVATPVSIRTLNTVDLAGGLFKIHADYSAIVPQWVADGKLFTSLPGYSVSSSYDSVSGFTSIFAQVPEPTFLSLLALGAGVLFIRRR